MNLVAHFKPQVDEIVSELFVKGYTTSELTKPLSNTMYWWQSPMYVNVTLHFDSATLDIKGWLCAAEALASEEVLNQALMQCFKDAIEYQWDVRQKDLQEDLQRELVVELEGVA